MDELGRLRAVEQAARKVRTLQKEFYRAAPRTDKRRFLQKQAMEAEKELDALLDPPTHAQEGLPL